MNDLDPIDYGPYDRDLWIVCGVCGREFGDDREFDEHHMEPDE